MKKIEIKAFIPHITAVILFFIISLVYFFPVLEGYQLKQGDIEKHKAMSKEISNFQEKYDERALWSGNMFAGMPTYMTTKVKFTGNISAFLLKVYRGGLPHPASAIFASMLGFFILLLCLRINPWLSIVGAIAFAFSSYFFIIIEAGHTSKTYAIALMAPVLGGFIQAIRGNLRIGFILITIFTALQLYVNHLQITYYLLMILVFVGVAELIAFAKSNQLGLFFKRIGVILLAALLGILPNLTNLLISVEYSKESTRGKSELTISSTGASNEKVVSGGLDKDYITQWSYGIDETMTLIIPNAKGGNSYPILGREAEVERLRKEDQKFFNLLVSEYQNNQNAISGYFGNQPIVSGPVYAGILVVFLAILALACLRKRILIPLTAVTVLTIMLAWGKNFMGLTEFFIDYIPGYNKFRAVAMILLVAEFTLPIMAILFIHKLIKDKEFIKKQQKKVLIVSAIFVGILGLVVLSPATFIGLSSDKEQAKLNAQLSSGNSGQIVQVYDQVTEYREGVVSKSATRSLLILIVGVALVFLFLSGKIKSKVLIVSLGVIIFGDLWSINKEYVHNKKNPAGSAANKYMSWIKPEKFGMPYDPSAVDQKILNTEIRQNPQIQANINSRLNEYKKSNKGRLDQRKSSEIMFAELMESTHYRVLNTNARLDQDVVTPYFHKTLGGYHGAKLKKFQELVDFYLGIEHFKLRDGFVRGGVPTVQSMLPYMQAANLLNAKYIIGPDNTGKSQAVVINNPNALGNAWFVNEYEVVPNADSAILAIGKTNLRRTAIVESEDVSTIANKSISAVTNGSIRLKRYSPNEMIYSFKSNADGLAVFSEIYYTPGWKAYINGKESDFLKVNYVLRGMYVPQGEGEIVFKFEPTKIAIGKTLTWASSSLIVILVLLFSLTELGILKGGLKKES